MNWLESIQQCLNVDQIRLNKKLKACQKLTGTEKQEALGKLEEQVSKAIERVAARNNSLPEVAYPDLPIVQKKADLLEALKHQQVIVVAGETGSGKSTQLAKICLEAGLGRKGFIGHTQPRRIAAVSIAKRLSEELGSPLGDCVGYKIRFKDRSSASNHIKVLTDGMLLAETQTDRLLLQYDAIIIDEAHERSLNIDILFGLLKRILYKRPSLKVIITSATIQLEKFSTFFNQAPIIEVSGRQFPVQRRYLQEDQVELDVVDNVVRAVKAAIKEGPGDILIFQSGEKEIREVIEVLQGLKLKSTTILPLFARLNQKDQHRIFQSMPGRKIIVATNVAETSITVPNIKYVIDSGLHKVNRYNPKNRLHRLEIEAISQSSVTQRSGRCGRVGPGIYFGLFTEADLITRPQYNQPEILRSSLAKVLLNLLALNIKDPKRFYFIDSPDAKQIKDGLRLLNQLEAIDSEQQLTPIGRMMARLPIEPRLARILIAANHKKCLTEMCIIGSALSMADPREEPYEKRQQAREMHQQHTHPESEFLGYLKLWEDLKIQKKALTHKEFVTLCRKNYLSYVRVCEWIDLYEELKIHCKEMKLTFNEKKAEYAQLHCALLTGFLDTIGLKDDKEYLGARNLKFRIHPSSHIKKTNPWILAGEIFHTQKTYAKTIANIDAAWLVSEGQHLLKRSYLEPYFDLEKQGVMAIQKSSLFGLPVENKKIHFDKIQPALAHEIFIRQALVEKQIRLNAPFYTHNLAILNRLNNLTVRTRYQYALVNEDKVFSHYQNAINKEIASTNRLKNWIKEHGEENLRFNLTDFIDESTLNDILENFPDHLEVETLKVRIEYSYDPQSDFDGATLTMTPDLVGFVLNHDLSWLIPGWMPDKILADLRLLQKPIRQRLPPIKDVAHKFLAQLRYGQGNYYDQLVRFLATEFKVALRPDIFQEGASLQDNHLRWHFRVVDAQGRLIQQGDSLSKIFDFLKDKDLVQDKLLAPKDKERYTAWEFNDLPESRLQKYQQKTVKVYPAIVKNECGVSIAGFPSQELAQQYHALGLCKLYELQLNTEISYLKKQLKNKKFFKAMDKYLANELTLQNLIDASIFHCFVVRQPNIRQQKQFQQHLRAQKSQLVVTFNTLATLLQAILHKLENLYLVMNGAKQSTSLQAVLQDIQSHIDFLLGDQFLICADLKWLSRYPTYLEVSRLRLEKDQHNTLKDLKHMKVIHQLEALLKQKRDSELSEIKESLYLPVTPKSQKINLIKWQIQELRVSLFAQRLGTIVPVSQQRILKELT